MKRLLFLLSFLTVFCSEHTTEPPIQDDTILEISEFSSLWSYSTPRDLDGRIA